jgi:hypothetical protein
VCMVRLTGRGVCALRKNETPAQADPNWGVEGSVKSTVVATPMPQSASLVQRLSSDILSGSPQVQFWPEISLKTQRVIDSVQVGFFPPKPRPASVESDLISRSDKAGGKSLPWEPICHFQ